MGPADATTDPIESKEVRGSAVGRGWGWSVTNGRENDREGGLRGLPRLEMT